MRLRRILCLWYLWNLFFNLCNPCSAELSGMSWLDNGVVRVGVDLDLGGAITHVSRSGDPVNLVNSHDWGRQIQMSHYSGPVPFAVPGKPPHPAWAGLGWNPIQSGDCYGHRSRTTAHRNDGRTMTTACLPMQWPLDDVPGDCVFETRIALAGDVIRVAAKVKNRRADRTGYGARHQELPALYTVGTHHRLMTYAGDRPFTNGELTEIVKTPEEFAATNHFPWKAWLATEHWAALVNDANQGLGIRHEGVVHFLGGFHGQRGVGGPKDGPTGYIAPIHNEIFDPDIEYEYAYELIVGSLDVIRKRVYALGRPPAAPVWRFQKDRRHWTYHDATDTGWPIRGRLEVKPAGSNPQLIGPDAFWRAENGPVLAIEIAAKGATSGGRIYWKRLDAHGFALERSVPFTLVADGKFQTIKVRLADSPEYRGGITGLRIDPVPSAGATESPPRSGTGQAPPEGGGIQVKSIRLER